jgi:RNA polymerase sigma factor FliA
MKKRSEEPGTDLTAANADDHLGAKDWLFTEIAVHGHSMGISEKYRRDELLPLLAQRLARLPLRAKKVLAMYYYENLPVPGIATYLDLPAWRITEILTQTVCLLRNDLPNSDR